MSTSAKRFVDDEDDIDLIRELSTLNAQRLPVQNENPNHDELGRFASAPGEAVAPVGGNQKFAELKTKWATLNSKLLDHVDRPDSPEAKELAGEMKDVVKEMHRVRPDSWRPDGRPGKDMVVIGGGPAGLAAAVMGGTDGLNTLFIESQSKKEIGGQAKHSSRIENYPGFPVGVTGNELMARMRDQAERVGAEGKYGVKVTKLEYDDKTGMKTLTLSNGEQVRAKTVIISAGLEFRKVNFQGADSKNVIYADGEKLAKISKGKPVVIIGGSNGAAQAALGVAKTASHVYVMARNKIEESMSDYQVSAIRNHPKVTVIEGDQAKKFDEQHHKMITEGGKSLQAFAIGVFIGSTPSTSWLPKEVGIHGQTHKIKVDKNFETRVPGVFAAGDVRHGSIGRVGASVGEGQVAEHGVFGYLNRTRGRGA